MAKFRRTCAFPGCLSITHSKGLVNGTIRYRKHCRKHRNIASRVKVKARAGQTQCPNCGHYHSPKSVAHPPRP